MTVPQRRYQLVRLQQELAAGGFVYDRLAAEGDTVYSYDAKNQMMPLPPETQPILAAHDPTKRVLTPEQVAVLARFRALRDATTVAGIKAPLVWLIWWLIKQVSALRDGDEEATS